MSERDTRPRYGEMPRHVRAVLEKYEPELIRIVAALYDAVVASRGAPLAELTNEGLSLMSQCAAVVAASFIAKLADTKGYPIASVAQIGMDDVIGRTATLLDGLIAIRTAPGQSRQ